MPNEDEALQLTNVESQRTTVVRVLNRQPMDAVTGEIIERLTVALTLPDSQYERVVSLVVKRLSSDLISFSPQEIENHTSVADVWIDRWKLLKAAGIPVVPMARKLADNKVAMTDLTVDGSVVYGKADISHRRFTRSLDHLVSTIDIHEVEKQAQLLAQRATQHGIIFSHDDALALVLRPNGSWQLMALDIGFTRRESDIAQNPYIHLPSNAELCGVIVNHISALQQKIR